MWSIKQIGISHFKCRKSRKFEDILTLLVALWESEIEINGKACCDLPACTLQYKLLCKENEPSGCCHSNMLLARTGRFSYLINIVHSLSLSQTHTHSLTHALSLSLCWSVAGISGSDYWEETPQTWLMLWIFKLVQHFSETLPQFIHFSLQWYFVLFLI